MMYLGKITRIEAVTLKGERIVTEVPTHTVHASFRRRRTGSCGLVAGARLISVTLPWTREETRPWPNFPNRNAPSIKRECNEGKIEKECLDILSEKMTRGEISRRRFIVQIAAFLIAMPLALQAKGARAAADELVFVNWGGDAGKAYDAAYGQAFKTDTGVTVKQDGLGPTEGAIEAQVKSGKPSWISSTPTRSPPKRSARKVCWSRSITPSPTRASSARSG